MTRKLQHILDSVTPDEQSVVEKMKVIIQGRLAQGETKTEVYNHLSNEYPPRLIYAAAGATSIPWRKKEVSRESGPLGD